MDRKIIELLKSDDPDERMRGIKRLVASGHPDALKILAQIQNSEKNTLVTRAVEDASEAISKRKAKPGELSAIPYDPDSARAYLEKAVDATIALNKREAWKWAKQAFLTDPDLAYDEQAIKLVIEITGVDRMLATDTLLAADTDTIPERAPQPKKKESRYTEKRLGWGKALTGVGIYALMIALIFAIPFFLFAGSVGSFIAGISPDLYVDSLFATYRISVIGGTVAVVVFILVISCTILFFGIVHYAATTILHGKGYLTNLLNNVWIPLILTYIVQLGLFLLMYFIMGSPYAGNEDADSLYQFLRFVRLLSLNLLITLLYSFWIGRIAGKTYDFSAVRGWFAFVIAIIITFLLAGSCFLLSILSALFQFTGSSA